MKSRFRHNSAKRGFMIFFTVTLQPFIKYHSPPLFSSRKITKSTETHSSAMRDVIIEQPPDESFDIFISDDLRKVGKINVRNALF